MIVYTVLYAIDWPFREQFDSHRPVPRLLMGLAEHNIIVSDLYPRLLTHLPDYNIIVTHPTA